jgi:hypothetical protein
MARKRRLPDCIRLNSECCCTNRNTCPSSRPYDSDSLQSARREWKFPERVKGQADHLRVPRLPGVAHDAAQLVQQGAKPVCGAAVFQGVGGGLCLRPSQPTNAGHRPGWTHCDRYFTPGLARQLRGAARRQKGEARGGHLVARRRPRSGVPIFPSDAELRPGQPIESWCGLWSTQSPGVPTRRSTRWSTTPS